MKRILGLDLGSSSIGWAVILTNDNNNVSIEATGVRIIPYEGTEGKDFEKGTGESRNSLRTQARTIRKGYDRYQLRRANLVEKLNSSGLTISEETKLLSKMELWALRSRAVHEQISLSELGRLLMWMNQKRGYKSSRSDSSGDKKDTQYVAEVKNRYSEIKEKGLTIGQYFYDQLSDNPNYRVRERVFPREAYIEEFDTLINRQQQFYPNILTEIWIDEVRNRIIYYQRPLKSQKGLVSICEFEQSVVIGKNGKEQIIGPKVAHRSSPLAQMSTIWESVNNIKLKNAHNQDIEITSAQRQAIFNYLNQNEKLTASELLKMVELKRKECFVGKQLEKGIKGNATLQRIKACFADRIEAYEPLLRMKLPIVETDKERYSYSTATGELLGSKNEKFVDHTVEQEPLMRLWHTIYSISDMEECSAALQRNFKIEKEIADRLSQIDFSKTGYSNKSTKVIRKILPYLIDGETYDKAMQYGGYSHSFSLSKTENANRKLKELLTPIAKNTLRQPIVEKILNQMIGVVNQIISQYGKPDEIRVELARELKQSKEERAEAEKSINKRTRENEEITKKLDEYGIRATRNNIIKYRLFQEISDNESRQNGTCVYCGQPISFANALGGDGIEIEHIIPKSKLFDDSQSNKTLAHRSCNSGKNDRTAYDFMKDSKSDVEFAEYVARVNGLYDRHIIGKSKRDKLLMSENDIPQNFIDRQLRESQYIAKKALEILRTICTDVWSTSGTITSELRHLWGWDEVTMQWHLPQYKEHGLVKLEEWESDHGKQKHSKEVIDGWSKRDDHRHHAVDALTIACTKQGYIQRFNTLNSSETRDLMKAEVEKGENHFKEKRSLLEKYIIKQRPLSTQEVYASIDQILISFKEGKKVAVWGKRKEGRKGKKQLVQTGILIPRGSLSEESVYGKINHIELRKPVKYLFENPDLIFKPYIRRLIEERIESSGGDAKKALSSLKKSPIYLDSKQETVLEYATCYKSEYVIKYKVNSEFSKLDKVIDKGLQRILKTRLEKFKNNPKEAFKDVQQGEIAVPWYIDEGLDRPIHSVRCLTGLSAVVPVKKDENGNDIGFVKPGNNHHVAIYSDAEGKRVEHICSFWHAVERKKYGIPVVINDSNAVWDQILSAPEGSFPESFLEQLPQANCQLDISMQQNQMFILGLPHDEVKKAIREKEYGLISRHLYRVQKLSKSNYMFRHHLETQILDNENCKSMKRFISIRSINGLLESTPYKVRINNLGHVTDLKQK